VFNRFVDIRCCSASDLPPQDANAASVRLFVGVGDPQELVRDLGPDSDAEDGEELG